MSRERVDVAEIIDTQDRIIRMQSELIQKMYSYIAQNSECSILFESDVKIMGQMIGKT